MSTDCIILSGDTTVHHCTIAELCSPVVEADLIVPADCPLYHLSYFQTVTDALLWLRCG